jgi:hypothetical protein
VAVRWYVVAIFPAPIAAAGILLTRSLTSPLLAAGD